MANVIVTDKDIHEENLLYMQSSLAELFGQTDCKVLVKQSNGRSAIIVDCPIICFDLIKGEIDDRASDVIVVNYKYEYFKNAIRPEGLNSLEREILLAGIISADIEEDKRYVMEKLNHVNEYALDGVFNFRLRLLKRKWEEIADYIPKYFARERLKEFIGFLLEDKKKKVFIKENKVYDSHYRRLTRSTLLGDNDECGLIKEILLSNCGEIELEGKISERDEYYIKQFYGDRVTLSKKYFGS